MLGRDPTGSFGKHFDLFADLKFLLKMYLPFTRINNIYLTLLPFPCYHATVRLGEVHRVEGLSLVPY